MRRIPALARDTTRAAKPVWLVVAALALVAAVAGTGVVVRRHLPPTSFPSTATLGGLSVRLHDAGWLGMDSHSTDNQGGYQMPAQMMPGAPVGDDMRLGVPLTLVNTTGRVAQFDLAKEFTLGGGVTDEPRPLHSDTFGALPRLTPGNAVDGVLYFDTKVPDPSRPQMYLIWTRAGGEVRLAVSLPGGSPDHDEH